MRSQTNRGYNTIATQLTCYRFVQLAKESFDGAQALLNLVVLAPAAVVRRRCRKRFGHLYRRCWSHCWEWLSCFEADGRLHYSPRHGHAHGVAHGLLCSAATLGQAPRRIKSHPLVCREPQVGRRDDAIRVRSSMATMATMATPRARLSKKSLAARWVWGC